jgi:signal transduction histidine kinase
MKVASVAAGLLLGVAWLSGSVFFLSQVRAADGIRSRADHIRIDQLETRRREKDFLLRSLNDPAFYLEGSTSYLQLHQEALDLLGRDIAELEKVVPPEWPVGLERLTERKREYADAFAALVARYRQLGYKEFGLEGVLNAGLAELEARASAVPPAAQQDLALLRADEKEYLLRSSEASLSAIQRRIDRLRGEAPDLGALLDRHQKDLAGYRAAEVDLGLDENLGLQGRFRGAVHEIEPIVERVVVRAGTEYVAAVGRLTSGLVVSSVLLAILLSTTFTLTKSARKQTRDLAGTATELARSNAELQQFAYVASHDLQEPLRAVAGCVQLLEQRMQDRLEPRDAELIRHAVEGCIRMQTLIEDLLTLSRVNSKARPPVGTSFEDVLRVATDNLAVPIQESGAVITHDPLPTVAVDPTQMVQVFQNLLGNAIKFRSQKPPAIHVGAQRHPDGWRFSVRDNGIGIERQYFDRIFRVFQRLHTREEYPGSGIGLAVCEKIVLRHGGRIWLESEENRGTTFFFSLPDRGAAV